jgi:phosphoesterase RecJ-like protein
MKDKLIKLEKLINKADKILLLNHLKMDWDAIGSLWTLYIILKKLWKNVGTTNDLAPEKVLKFLWVSDIFEQNLDLEKFNPDLIICLDVASVSQLWKIYSENTKFFKWREMVVIDHHISNTKFWTLNIIDKEASSTCELLFFIIKKLWYYKYLNKKCVNLLLAWIVTDTNIFYNKNTTVDSLEIASKLFEKWGNLNKIIHNFYNQISFEKLRLKWILFEKVQRSKDKKIVWIRVLKEDLEKTGVVEKDYSGIINELLSVDGCEVSFILYPFEWEVKASFRSKNYDVWSFCKTFPGGWWHKLAAWFRSTTKAEILEKEILKKLKI